MEYRKIYHTGNSDVIALPAQMLKAMNIKIGDLVKVYYLGDRIEIMSIDVKEHNIIESEVLTNGKKRT